MNASKGLGVLVLCAIVVVAGLSYFAAPPPDPAKPDTVYLKVSEKSAAVAETTIRTVTRYRARVDTLPGDTVWMTRYQIDTLFQACEACADQLREHRRISDSVIAERDGTIVKLRAKLASCSKQKPWYAIGGLLGGGLTCRR